MYANTKSYSSWFVLPSLWVLDGPVCSVSRASVSPSLVIPDRAVSPMMQAMRLSNGESSVVVCPPPVADISRLCAVTRFLANTLMSNHFFLISGTVLSSDPTELTALVTFSHAAFFPLFVIPPAVSELNNICWLDSTSSTSNSNFVL